MSVDAVVYLASKPTEAELKRITCFSYYDEPDYKKDPDYYDESNLMIFEESGKGIEHLKKGFVAEKDLITTETKYEELYKYLGFSEESIKEEKVHLQYCTLNHYEYTDGNLTKEINREKLEGFMYKTKKPGYIVKMEKVFDSSEDNWYYEREALEKLKKFYPQYDPDEYIPASNTMFSLIELPFLIFKKNSRRCFLKFWY